MVNAGVHLGSMLDEVCGITETFWGQVSKISRTVL